MGSRAPRSRGRPGRPAGSPPNREAILAAARKQFIERGYEGATIRSIAAQAAIDPALVLHYFGSKERLFVASLREAFGTQADRFIQEQLTTGTDGLGERLLRAFLEAWAGEPVAVATAVAFLGAASRSGEAARVLREVAEPEGGISRLISALGLSQPRLRAALVGSTLFGLAMARFVVRLEPIASADIDTLVACYAPTVQGYLTRPLPGDVY